MAGKKNEIWIGKKPRTFRILIQERTLDDKTTEKMLCITIKDFTHKVNALSIKEHIRNIIKKEFEEKVI